MPASACLAHLIAVVKKSLSNQKSMDWEASHRLMDAASLPKFALSTPCMAHI